MPRPKGAKNKSTLAKKAKVSSNEPKEELFDHRRWMETHPFNMDVSLDDDEDDHNYNNNVEYDY